MTKKYKSEEENHDNCVPKVKTGVPNFIRYLAQGDVPMWPWHLQNSHSNELNNKTLVGENNDTPFHHPEEGEA